MCPDANCNAHARDNRPADRFVWLAWTMLACAIIFGAYMLLRSPVLPEDDAYITFRYAKHAASGRGLVYNESQRVCGVTSPLYLLILTSMSFVAPSIPVDVLAVRMNVIPWAVIGALTFILLRRWLKMPLLAAVGGACALLDPRLIERASDGMESCCFVVWVLLFLIGVTGQKTAFAAICAGLAMLTRPEGVFLLALLVLVQIRHPKKSAISIAISLLIIAPWVLFACWYFGTPVPHSILAKARPLYAIPPGFAQTQLLNQLGLAWLSAVLIGSAVIVVDWNLRRGADHDRPPTWLSAGFFWILVLFYSITNPLMFRWYYPPLYGVGLVIFVCAACAIGRGLASLLTDVFGEAPSAGIRAAAKAALSLALLYGTKHAYASVREELPPDRPYRLRALAYKDCAEYLSTHVQKGDRVATPEVGALGYWFDGRIIDGCGLVSPEALPYLPVRGTPGSGAPLGALSAELVRDQRPEWVVSLPHFLTGTLSSAGWFPIDYELIQEIPLHKGPLFGDMAVAIYHRRAARS